MKLKPVIQEEITGCGIASVANLLDRTYAEMKEIASSMGIHASDESLWSDTQYVRKMLTTHGVKVSETEVPFSSWDELPDLALLSIKYHKENITNYWHWVVFKRTDDKAMVLDSASYLSSNVRTDFKEMQPKWYIEVNTI